MEIAGAAKGAVDSLLGRISSVLVDEVKLLRRVRRELVFIKDEMESMNSFLLDLQEAKRPSNQQKTWMKQVRELAYAAERCINLQQALSLREGPRGNGLLGCLPPVRTMRHRHQLAKQIQELKERIEKVNQRRQRYGVDVPKGDKTGQQALVSKMTWFGAAIGADLLVLDEDEVNNAIIMSDGYVKGVLGFSEEANILKECTTKLVKWLTTDSVRPPLVIAANEPPPFDRIAVIAAPDKEDGGDVAREALKDPTVSRFFENKVWLKVDYKSLLFALNVKPQDGVWYALCTMLDNYLPVNDDKKLANRDTWNDIQIANEISKHLRLQSARSLILIEGFQAVKDGRVWDWMEEALSKFGCAVGSAAIMITADNHDTILPLQSRNWQVITYSVVQFFYYKALVVLERTYRVYLSSTTLLDILRKIQKSCDQDAFCLKMFVHYLYANPNRTKEEVDELLKLLVYPEHALEEALDQKIKETNDKKLLKFCYDDLPRSYKTCLMHLAIFPLGEEIRRSRLVGRWIVEGLITRRDMPEAVREAERCFKTLLNRSLVCPGDIGTSGKIKSCVVKHKLVQELIIEMATEEQFLDTRLSHHLAQHFSVHSSLQFRRSDTLTAFMQSLRRGSCINLSYTSSHLQPVKALDLEGSSELKIKDPYIVHKIKDPYIVHNITKCLKNICNNILLLRYLSLRNTNVTMLPKEINKLNLLEILDIRQTRVPPSATKDIMLPKLKCLLAGLPDQIPNTGAIRAEKSFSSVQIPRKIKKMANIEVLSHVEASVDATELKDIGQLLQLRKLGVDIIDNKDHLEKLLQAISDLNECLQSLSIRIITPLASSGVTTAPSNTKVPDDGSLIPPKRLESLNIRGITSGQLLPLFFKHGHQLIAKVTLHSTMLKRDDLETSLAKLPNLRCLRLGHKSYIELELTFKKEEFETLKFLVVDCSEITKISFDDRATPKLEKIVWFITDMGSLSGIDNLPKLRDLELNGECVRVQVQETTAAHRRS